MAEIASGVRAQIDLSLTPTASFVERFGLFTIIVLGEVLVGVIRGVAGHQQLTAQVAVIGAMGMLVAVGLWWLYFDFVSHRHPGRGRELLWVYGHLPLTAGIATAGAAVQNAIEYVDEPLPSEVRWQLVGSVALALPGMALLTYTLHDTHVGLCAQRHGMVTIVLVSVIILVLGFSTVQPILLLGLVAMLLLFPIFLGFVFWIKGVDSAEAAAA